MSPTLFIVMDGTPIARMAGTVVEAIKSPTFDNGPSEASPSLTTPQALDWEISPAINAAIARAQSAAHSLVGSQTLSFLRTSYGKSTIKKMGYSPDSYAQMVIQLGYHRLISSTSSFSSGGRIGGTYEAATTRKFAHGRTEVIRVVSEESEAWCAAVDKYMKGEVGKDVVVRLFGEAVKAHGAYARAAGNGLGVDRHLFGVSSQSPF
jgi:carnitine O-acetyltransferase